MTEAIAGETSYVGDPADRTSDRSSDIERIVSHAAGIPGWTRDEEAHALVQASLECPDHAVIVEIGSFLGSSAVLLAGGRRLAGSGRVHCVDPFDLSGDAFSTPFYREIVAGFGGRGARALFDANLADAGLADWVEAHAKPAADAARDWFAPIDLLFLDGDQSPEGVSLAYDAWSAFLKPGGRIAVHNSEPGPRAPGHDGHVRLVEGPAFAAAFEAVRLVGSTTFARKRRAPA